MTFYKFTPAQKLTAWKAFPTAAYTDERVWQSFVPGPGGILGVKIDEGPSVSSIICTVRLELYLWVLLLRFHRTEIYRTRGFAWFAEQ
jgi:hypothetical protein